MGNSQDQDQITSKLLHKIKSNTAHDSNSNPATERGSSAAQRSVVNQNEKRGECIAYNELKIVEERRDIL